MGKKENGLKNNSLNDEDLNQKKNIEDDPNRKNILRVTLWIVVLLTLTLFVVPAYFVPTHPLSTETITLTDTITPSATLAITSIAKFITIPASTPSQIHPTPVVKWHSESPDCTTESLVPDKKIIGVEVFGDNYPYKIEFRQYSALKATRYFTEGGNFTTSVIVDKGENVYVTMFFRKINEELIWESYLFYPQIDPECQH